MEKLLEFVQNENWTEAEGYVEKLVLDDLQVSADFYVLAAEVMLQLKKEERAYHYIVTGLKQDPFHYELYYMLGNYYAGFNRNQAYLCYEMAAFYAGNTEDEAFLCSFAQAYFTEEQVVVRPVSIVIVSYNSKDIMINCIESIREANPAATYELVVVDNASKDGIAEWLEEQEDIVLRRNHENAGFALACNQGVELAAAENDIFFLNNDTIVPPNALFWLRMGLYENEKIGAVGSVTNQAANGQMVIKDFEKIEDWLLYANEVNVPMEHPYEKKIWLVGFAMMIKRNVLDEVGLFDLQFGIGNFEDNDLGMRILQAGYQLNLCKNSFIYHFGSLGFKQNDYMEHLELMKKNRRLLREKWGFDITYYTHARSEVIEMIDQPKECPIRVLEVGCGAGATLAKIQYLWPNAEVKGIELDDKVAALGSKYLDIVEGNIESMTLTYEKEYFDYIIFADVLEHLYAPDAVLEKVIPFLKKDGCILTSIPNIMHVSVLLPLLMGKFEYQDAGILDRTHVRFFTLDSVLEMMKKHQLNAERVAGTHHEEEIIAKNRELYGLLTDALGEQFELQTKAYQYIVRARKTDDN